MSKVISNYIRNFPFTTLRTSQENVLSEIDSAFASGYKRIILETPTGFGKSPVAISTALTLGPSYICTSTKDLQSQYARDFQFVRLAKGKSNFLCEVKDDFIRNHTYKCDPCGLRMSTCPHTSVEYGPCMSDDNFRCSYKTLLKDYTAINKGTMNERVILAEGRYRNNYFEWSHLNNLKEDAI